MNKKSLFFCFFFLLATCMYGTIPTGYYSTAEGKKAAVLKTELHTIICQDTTHYLDYGSGIGKTWQGFYYTDRDPATNAVLDMYSANVRYFPNPNPDFAAFGSTIEIEHSVPKSWWGCDITHPDCAAKDLNHLFPADGTTNMSKNDNPLGVVSGTPTTNNGVSKIGSAVYDGYVGNVFEPADQYKGDFARAYFYMATAYEHYASKWDTSKPENMMQNNRYPVLKPWAIALLLQWHRQDPVSAKEVVRNDVVYGIQKNRNPFIDYPKLVEYIWGDRTTIPFRQDGVVLFPYLNWPNDNDTINLGSTYYQQPKDTVINLKAMNLTGNLTLSLGGTNAANFSLNKTTITKAEAEAGTTFQIHFLTSLLGNSSAILTISGGGISTLIIKLKTSTTDDFAALPASITSNSGFVANWTPSSGATGYTLNVYTIENTGTSHKTLIEEDFLLALPNNWSKDGYIINTSGTEKLGTADTYGKLILPLLNLSTAPSTLTVRAKQYNNDNGAPLMASLDNQVIATWATTAGNQDFTVNIPVWTSNSNIAIYTVAGKRVYVDYVKVALNVPVYSPVSLSGYPKPVGNVLTYTVSGLENSKTYYYTVTPEGNGGSVSNQVMVRTGLVSGTSSNKLNEINYSISNSVIRLRNIPVRCKLCLYDTMGRIMQSYYPAASESILPIHGKGIYILKLTADSVEKIIKIIP